MPPENQEKFISKLQKAPEKVEGGKLAWKKFQKDTKNYYDKHKASVIKLMESVKGESATKVNALKKQYLREMANSVDNVVDGNEATKEEMAEFKGILRKRSEQLHKDVEKEKIRHEFKDTENLLGVHGMKFPKAYVEAYLKCPKNKRVPIERINKQLALIMKAAKGVWQINNPGVPESVLPISAEFGKLQKTPGLIIPKHKPLLLRGDQSSIYTALGQFCNGYPKNGNILLKALHEKHDLLVKMEDCMKINPRLKKLGQKGMNKLFAALMQVGVPKNKVADYFTSEFKKLNEFLPNELQDLAPMTDEQYIMFLAESMIARRGPNKKEAKEYILVRKVIERQHILNLQTVKRKKTILTAHMKLVLTSLQNYKKEKPDVGYDKKIMGYEAQIVKLQSKIKSYETVKVYSQMLRLMSLQALNKKDANLKDDRLRSMIGGSFSQWEEHPLDGDKNLGILQEFSRDTKVPIPPLLATYKAVLLEKKLIELDSPSNLLEDSKHKKLLMESMNDFMRTGKLPDNVDVSRLGMLELLQNKALKIKHAKESAEMEANSYDQYFQRLSTNYEDVTKVPPEKQMEVRAKLTGYLSTMNVVRKFQAKYFSVCKDFKFCLMLKAPKGMTPLKFLKKIDSYKHTYTKQVFGYKDDPETAVYEERVYQHRLSPLIYHGILETAATAPTDTLKDQMTKVLGFMKLKGKLPEFNHLAGSDIMQPIIKSELADTFDLVEGLYADDGDIGFAVGKIQAIPLKMKHDQAVYPETMLSGSFDECLGYFDTSLGYLRKARGKINSEIGKLDGLLMSNIIDIKYKDRPELAKQVKKSIKMTATQLKKMVNDKKSIISDAGLKKVEKARKKFKKSRDKYIKHKFYAGLVFAGTLVAAVATAMVGGSAFAALGTRLFARVASAAIQKALITTTSMVGASAGGVVGSRAFQTFAHATDMADMGGYGKIWGGKQMGKDFLIGFALSMGAVSAGRGLMYGLERGAASRFTRLRGLSQRGLNTMKNVGKILDPDSWFQGRGSLTNSALKRYGAKLGGETAQEGFEELMEKVHPVAGFLASVGSCSHSPNVELAMHGVVATDIGITTEGNNFVYTTGTGKEFAAQIKKEFNAKGRSVVETEVDSDGTVFLHLKKEFKNKKTGEIVNKRYSTIKIKPSQDSLSLYPEAEVKHVKGVKTNEKNQLEINDAKEHARIKQDLESRGFLVAQSENGTLFATKGEQSFKIKCPTFNEVKAEGFLTRNKNKLRKYFKNKTFKEGFIHLMKDCQGSYAKFREKYPRLAKVLPKDLLKIRFIPIPRIAAVIGADFVSVSDLDAKASRKASTMALGAKEGPPVSKIDRKASTQIKGVSKGEPGPVMLSPQVEVKSKIDSTNKIALAELNTLKGELEKIGLHDIAKEIANPDVGIVKGTNYEIKTLQQRRDLVVTLTQQHQEIKFKADFLTAAGLGTEIAKVINYGKNSKKYPTLQDRINQLDFLQTKVDEVGDIVTQLREFGLEKEAVELGKLGDDSKYPNVINRAYEGKILLDGLKELKLLGIDFTPENGAEIVGLLNGRSKNGMELKKFLIAYAGTEFLPRGKSLRKGIDTSMKKMLGEMLKGTNPDVINKIIEVGKSRHELKAEDKAILKANPKYASPEVIQAMLAGAKEVTNENGETVRMYSGKVLGEGGIALITEVWFVRKPSNKLENGVIKQRIPGKADSQDHVAHFNLEIDIAKDYIKITKENPNAEGSQHVTKPLYTTNDLVIYNKVADTKGESKDLSNFDANSSLKQWLGNFTGGIEGLMYLHKLGLTHGDFKPENIVIGKITNAKGEVVNTGVLIDLGSLMNHKNINNLNNPMGIFNTMYIPQMNTEMPSFRGRDGQTRNVGFTAGYHNPQLMADGINGRAPFNAGDRYAVGNSLLVALQTKGYATKTNKNDDFNHQYTLNDNAPNAAKQLFELAQKLRNVHDKSSPDYISLKNTVSKIKEIGLTL